MTLALRIAPVPARPGVSAPLPVAGRVLVADASGALYCEASGALIVADLHFEKGSSFARRGMMLPPYDSRDTLARLAAVTARYQPKIVISLGDAFHDREGHRRLGAPERAMLASLQRGRDWLWVAGNHDPDAIEGLGGSSAAEVRLGPLVLRHEPRRGAQPGEIAGHLHPAATVAGRGGAVRRRCFASDGLRCILPAFGVYAGGLDLRHSAFHDILPLRETPARIWAHVCGAARIYPVRGTRLA